MPSERDVALGALVKRYREAAGLSQTAVAEMLSREYGEEVKQNRLSDLEQGGRWQTYRSEIYAAFKTVLNIPVKEMSRATMGLDINGGDEPTTLREFIERDPSLSDAAKAHLINQYGLLQLASKQERAGHPVLDQPNPEQKSG